MNYKSVISILAILVFCGCQKETIQNEITLTGDGTSFTAVIEDEFSNTKTSVDSEGNVLWTKGDQVSIFAGSTNNDKYQVTDASDGKGSAELVPVSTGSGNDIDNNVALYPYQSTASITKSGDNYTISNITLPSIQPYAEGSFGNGAFPMVAVTSSTSDKSLKFKNIFGVLKLQLKGTASIVSIQITGNNNEILCGAASVTAANGNTPSIALTDESAKTVTLDCGEGVQLNNETATPFLIALPPMTMTGGFTVVVKDSEGKQMEIKTIKEQTITRSNILKMPVKDYVGVAKPLTFISTGSTQVALCKKDNPYDIALEYKLNDEEWTHYTIGTSISLNDRDQLLFQAGTRGNQKFSKSYSGFYYFKVLGSGTVAAVGNIMSLVDKNMETLTIPCDYFFGYLFYGCDLLTHAPELPATILTDRCYSSMFSGCTSLTTAPELPATVLADWCYSGMFLGCTSLTTAPELPATTLAENCYDGMFNVCTALTIPPNELPATILAENCYYGMFSGCTSLTTAPKLPATTLAPFCYSWMFSNCTSLITAPELLATNIASDCCHSMFANCSSLTQAPKKLPAETLAENCYQSMFVNCTSLTTAPELPATTLASSCYSNMFSGCTLLTTAPELPATTLASSCYSDMFSGCIALTTVPKELPATTLASSCYSNMFSGCTSLTTAPELPATTLASSCYSNMFSGCTLLTTAPELPATTLASSCYSNMFSGCIALTTVPKELPATTLASSCYSNMFSNCAALNTVPNLPATTLANRCYEFMFDGCTSLVSAPKELPAENIVQSCYCYMFRGCTSLITAPILPATTLIVGCYTGMFYGCTKLNYVKALFTTTPSDSYTQYWLSEVSSTGTFVKNEYATWNVIGPNGVPEGWIIQTE